jgi:hypothetical protein
MKSTCLFLSLCLTIACCGLSGCQPVPPPAPDPLDNLKITDLQDTTSDQKQADYLINFRVIQYLMDPNELAKLEPVYANNPQRQLHFQNDHAFEANGFAVAMKSRQDGTTIARALSDAGASRLGQTFLSIPPDSTEILSSISFYQPQSISFVASQDDLTNEYLYPGCLGWTIFAQNSAVRNTIILKLAPAYWQTGVEDLRSKLGKPPINYNLFDFAAFQTRLKEGDFLLLAPSRLMMETTTLNQALFMQPGKKIQAKCFVLILESAGL